MRSSKRRHLQFGQAAQSSLYGFTTVKSAAPSAPYESEFAPRDYAAYLLHVDAEIEHGLMVQYLYAAYSLGGPQVPEQHRDLVRTWRETILGIAKEEMGHLMSVQNVLRLIGAPLNLGRDDYPWDVPFYPFAFTLEPLTLDSLAKYVYAESPVNWSGKLADEVKKRVEATNPSPNRVAELFELLIRLMEDPHYIPDSAFQSNTYSFQASWDEWGRGYQGGKPAKPSPLHSLPDVLVVPQACRDDAVAALKQIAEQGEATTNASGVGPSHFERFKRIYEEMSALEHEGWRPAREVAVNPYLSLDPAMDPAQGLEKSVVTSPIIDPQARLWASLHNMRYRMLLAYLTHSFTLDGGLMAAGTRTPRGAIINATFGEMYNLRAIADILMQLPLGGQAPDSMCAGPPFQMPYTLDSPFGEANRWRLHVDLLTAAASTIKALLKTAHASHHTYLYSMRDADEQMKATAERILANHIQLALT